MGGILCIPKSLKAPPELEDVLSRHPRIIHFTEQTCTGELRAEATELLARSFCGSRSTAPEGLLSHTISPNQPNIEECLAQDPTPERLEFFRFMAKWALAHALRHNGCFGLLDEKKEQLVAITVTFLPNQNNLHVPRFFERLRIAYAAGPPPSTFINDKDVQRRLHELVERTLESHHQHAPGLHHYIWFLAVSIDHQGLGYGQRLMAFLNDLADALQVPAYLETIGFRNEQFYTRNGYRIQGHFVFDTLDPGFAAMVRTPSAGLSKMKTTSITNDENTECS